MYILSAIVKAPAVNNVGEGLVLEPGDSCFIKDADAAYYQRQPGVYTVTAVSPIGISTDSSGNAVLVGADGNSLVTFDANGNIVAHVNHRTGALDTLLALEGGVGEISVADDADAIVVHNGVALGAKAYRHSTKLGELHVHGTVASLVGGTTSIVDLTSTTVNTGATVDLVNNKFLAPAGSKYIKTTLMVAVSDPDVTAGTQVTGLVTDITGFVAMTSATGHIQGSESLSLCGVATVDFTAALVNYLQIRLLHNDATDAYAGVSVSAVVEFFGAN